MAKKSAATGEQLFLRFAAANRQVTAFNANGQCGGDSYTQWLHCNGVIGFGNISDNFN